MERIKFKSNCRTVYHGVSANNARINIVYGELIPHSIRTNANDQTREASIARPLVPEAVKALARKRGGDSTWRRGRVTRALLAKSERDATTRERCKEGGA